VLCTGVDWSDVDDPKIRLSPLGADASAMLIPLTGGLRFRLVEPGIRYCCGWFDLTATEPRHRSCSPPRRVTSGWQCPRCRAREGFLPVHQSHRTDAELPENVRHYIAQPHWLYLGVFADGSVKVGTVAQARFRSRLAEQGPVAGCYVGHAGNGVDIRKAEAAVSATFGLAESVSAKRKLDAVCRQVDAAALAGTLLPVADDVQSYLGDLAAVYGLVRPVDPVLRWEMPSIARNLVEATPLVRYPEDLTSGDHSLFVKAMNGPVAMFSLQADPAAELYAADLSVLRGMHLTFGEFASTVGAVQPALF
jgi:hypothetical protein